MPAFVANNFDNAEALSTSFFYVIDLIDEVELGIQA